MGQRVRCPICGREKVVYHNQNRRFFCCCHTKNTIEGNKVISPDEKKDTKDPINNSTEISQESNQNDKLVIEREVPKEEIIKPVEEFKFECPKCHLQFNEFITEIYNGMICKFCPNPKCKCEFEIKK